MRDVDEDSYYYVYNGHADVTALIDADTGDVEATYYYDPFGNILESTGSVNNNITYAGYQYDEETELYYLNARMYDPNIARFLQEDTYRGDPNDPLSLNLYSYCHNEPIMYFDPTGHWIDEIEERYAYEYWRLDDYERLSLLGSEWNVLDELYRRYGSERYLELRNKRHDEANRIRDKYENMVIAFQSQRMKGLNLDGTIADDLTFNDFSREQLLELSSSFEKQLKNANNPDYLFKELERRGKRNSMFSLEDVVLDMIDTFRKGDKEHYSNEVLTEKVQKHKRTKKYVKSIKKIVTEELQKHGGDVTKINYEQDTEYYNKIQKNVTQPYFNTKWNKATGLTMAINDTWSNNVIIREYEFDGETFKGILQFNIYDNFGVDPPDIEKHGHRFGFSEWFMLQHYDGYGEKYKPFITVMQFDVEFSGGINK
jgi:RHS repeat-associated protein